MAIDLPISKINEQFDSKSYRMGWIVWSIAAFFFFAEYLARVAPSVIVSDLMQSLGITATGFGTLTACFYWTYIPMQIPVGLMVDRVSMRWLLASMALVTAASCGLFAASEGLPASCAARLLLGFGAAFAFTGAIKLASMWFPSKMLGMLAGFTQAIGMLGAASGELPVAYMVDHMGWRQTLWGMAGLFLVWAILMAAILRERNVAEHHAGKGHDILVSLKVVLSNPQSWWNALYAGLLFVPTAVLGESWGVEYLKKAHGLSHHQAALANGMIFLGWGVGGPIVGALSDRLERRKGVMLASVVLSFACMALLVWGPVLEWNLVATLLFVYGFVNTGVGVAYALATEINPHQDSGMSVSFANMGSIMIGAALLPLVGTLIDWHASQAGIANGLYTGADFAFSMNILPLALIVCFIFACFVKETYCVHQQDRVLH